MITANVNNIEQTSKGYVSMANQQDNVGSIAGWTNIETGTRNWGRSSSTKHFVFNYSNNHFPADFTVNRL
jgi:hypothetical protein